MLPQTCSNITNKFQGAGSQLPFLQYRKIYCRTLLLCIAASCFSLQNILLIPEKFEVLEPSYNFLFSNIVHNICQSKILIRYISTSGIIVCVSI